MAYRRTTRRKPTQYRRRRRYNQNRRRAANKFGPTKSLNYKGVVFWKEKKNLQMVTNVPVGQTFITDMVFKLADLTHAAQFSQLWDHYKITGVKCTFYPMCLLPTPVNAGGVGLGQYQTTRIATKIDLDGGAPFVSWDNFMESNAKVRQFMGGKPVSVYFKPRMNALGSVDAATTNTVNIYDPKNQPWLDMRNQNVEYNMLRVAVNDPPNTALTDAAMNVLVTYYVAFKGKI